MIQIIYLYNSLEMLEDLSYYYVTEDTLYVENVL